MYRNHDNVFSIIAYDEWRKDYRDNGRSYVIEAGNKDIDEIDTGILLTKFKDEFNLAVSKKSNEKCIPIVTKYRDWEDFYEDETALLILDKTPGKDVDSAFISDLLEKTGRKDEYSVIDERDYKARDGEYLLTFSYGCPWKKRR